MTIQGWGQEKPCAYFGTPRSDLLELLQARTIGQVLDVGCGAGANADWLRRRGAERIVGVEPHPESAAEARARFDHIHPMPIEAAIPLLAGPFDVIVCADVLEHLVDPVAVLQALRALVAVDGALLISVPNIRHYRALARIAFGAGFRAEVSGTFDSTHLRFFTRRNLRDALIASGWSVERCSYPRSSAAGYLRTILGRLTLGFTDDWLAAEWYVVARPALPGNP